MHIEIYITDNKFPNIFDIFMHIYYDCYLFDGNLKYYGKKLPLNEFYLYGFLKILLNSNKSLCLKIQ